MKNKINKITMTRAWVTASCDQKGNLWLIDWIQRKLFINADTYLIMVKLVVH